MSVAEQDLATVLQQRTRSFADLYERQAYLVYNLALRICCEPGAAARAAERAFLSPAPEHELPRTVVAIAVAEAPARPRADGAAAQGLVALPAPQRAALALAGLADLDAAGVAAAMGIGEDAAAEL